MLSADGILGKNFSIISAGLDGLTQSQRMHAENLANMHTPGYRAKQVDFQSTLRHAAEDYRNGGPDGNSFFSAAPGLGSVSGNDAQNGARFTVRRGGEVNAQHEVHAMMNDNIRYRVLTQQATNKLNALKGVISEMGRS